MFFRDSIKLFQVRQHHPCSSFWVLKGIGNFLHNAKKLSDLNSAQHAAFKKNIMTLAKNRVWTRPSEKVQYGLFPWLTSDDLSDSEYLNSHSLVPKGSVVGEIELFIWTFSGTFGADSQFFRELVCTALFCTDPAIHLWGLSFIDHWAYSWAHASIENSHKHDMICLSAKAKRKKGIKWTHGWFFTFELYKLNEKLFGTLKPRMPVLHLHQRRKIICCSFFPCILSNAKTKGIFSRQNKNWLISWKCDIISWNLFVFSEEKCKTKAL